MKPIRDIPVVLGANVTLTLPLPLPEVPFGNVNHETVDEAVQGHPAGAVTAMVFVPMVAFKLTGDTLVLQTAPAWLTCTVPSAIASVAERGEAVGFAAIVTVMKPVPDAPAVLSVIQDAGDCAVHAHPPPVDTNIELIALLPFTFRAVGERV